MSTQNSAGMLQKVWQCKKDDALLQENVRRLENLLPTSATSLLWYRSSNFSRQMAMHKLTKQRQRVELKAMASGPTIQPINVLKEAILSAYYFLLRATTALHLREMCSRN